MNRITGKSTIGDLIGIEMKKKLIDHGLDNAIKKANRSRKRVNGKFIKSSK